MRGNRTQLEIATEAEIPVTTYQRMESGNYWPEHRNIEKIAKALGRNEIDLFHDPSSKYRTTPAEALKLISEALNQLPSKPYIRLGSDTADIDEALAEANEMLESIRPSNKAKKKRA